MRVISPAFEEGEIMPAHWCAPASDTLPRLEIEDGPPGVVSLVAIPEDPESPLGTVTHWLVWNIPPETRYLDPAHLPDGATAGLDTFRGTGGMGPPSPTGRRHYRWEIRAPDTVLDLSAVVSRARLDPALRGHVPERPRASPDRGVRGRSVPGLLRDREPDGGYGLRVDRGENIGLPGSYRPLPDRERLEGGRPMPPGSDRRTDGRTHEPT